MVERFKTKMKENGQTFAWFHKNRIDRHGISYVQFIQQLNDFAPVKDEVKKEMRDYLKN